MSNNNYSVPAPYGHQYHLTYRCPMKVQDVQHLV